MVSFLNIQGMGKILDDFYVAIKQSFVNNQVELLSRKFREVQNPYEFEDASMHNPEFDLFYGAETIKINYVDKNIQYHFAIYNDELISINMYISVNGNKSNYHFDYHDYCVHHGIAIDDRKFDRRNLSDYQNLEAAIKDIIEELQMVILTDEMQRILNTDYVPEIPIDWSRCGYK